MKAAGRTYVLPVFLVQKKEGRSLLIFYTLFYTRLDTIALLIDTL